MNIPYRPIALSLVAMIFSGIFLARAQAGGGHYFAPVSDPVVREECGSCHLAFPPSMLPASSWKRMMGELDKHFGADASVSPATAEHITRYLSENAADANDVLAAHRMLKAAYLTDVSPIMAEARMRAGGALDPIATYRASGYRAAKARERPAMAGSSSGIV